MKVTVHDLRIKCPKHGEVAYQSIQHGQEVIRVCPQCASEAKQPHIHPASPYPIQGTSPSVIEACGRGD